MWFSDTYDNYNTTSFPGSLMLPPWERGWEKYRKTKASPPRKR